MPADLGWWRRAPSRIASQRRPKSKPAEAAILGSKLVGVIPGSVLTSSTYSFSPGVTKRSTRSACRCSRSPSRLAALGEVQHVLVTRRREARGHVVLGHARRVLRLVVVHPVLGLDLDSAPRTLPSRMLDVADPPCRRHSARRSRSRRTRRRRSRGRRASSIMECACGDVGRGSEPCAARLDDDREASEGRGGSPRALGGDAPSAARSSTV